MTNANPKDGNGRQQAKKEKPVQREEVVEQEQLQPDVSYGNMQMVQQAIANPEDASFTGWHPSHEVVACLPMRAKRVSAWSKVPSMSHEFVPWQVSQFTSGN